jgi:hypothetical protein
MLSLATASQALVAAGCVALGCQSSIDLPSRAAAAEPADARPHPPAAAATWSSEWTAIFLDEWIAKREEGVNSDPISKVHLVFEEWFDTGHVRVSVRGDGWYAVELDGAIRWSGPRYHSSVRPARGFQSARDSYSGQKGGFPFLHHFGEFGSSHYMMRNLSGGPPLPSFAPCPASGDDGSGPYHAQMTLVLEDPAPAVLRSWWTSPQCAGFPHAIARDAWNLIERVAAGWVSRPSWYAPSSASPGTSDPDCRGFGGRIHGLSHCVRVDLKTGRSAPISRRANGPDAISLACDATTTIAGHTVALTCRRAPAPDAEGLTKRVEISLSIDGGRPIAIDTHEGYWDFIHTWIRPDGQALELTVDYGVLD